jgi:hypothetical protein
MGGEIGGIETKYRRLTEGKRKRDFEFCWSFGWPPLGSSQKKQPAGAFFSRDTHGTRTHTRACLLRRPARICSYLVAVLSLAPLRYCLPSAGLIITAVQIKFAAYKSHSSQPRPEEAPANHSAGNGHADMIPHISGQQQCGIGSQGREIFGRCEIGN